MEGPLSWEDQRRTTPVGAKVSLHPVADHQHIIRVYYHTFGEPVTARDPGHPRHIMGLVSGVGATANPTPPPRPRSL